MTTTIDITKAAIKDPMTRRELVKTALRAELEGRGIALGHHLGQFARDPLGKRPDDFDSIDFNINKMDAYYGSPNKDRLTISIAQRYGGKKKSYPEPKAGFDIPKIADRMLAVLKESREETARREWIRANEQSSSRLSDVIREEFPDLAYQFNGCSTEDNVKLSAQYLTIDQAREVATLLMKFKSEEK